MLLYLNLLVLLLLHTTLSNPLTTPSRGCAACKAKPSPSQTLADSSVSALAVGAVCGVYTLSCAHGLRCTPPEDEARPLRALLEGRGVCSNITGASPTEQVSVRDPTPGADPDEAPCRKLLTTLIHGLDAHLFKSHHDIYMPNCDRRGFFRKKQCWSSRGKQRGRCWCVDENGMPVSSNAKQKGSLSC
ncbi:insulin-like growth factor-binding protein 3 [Solea senegalensis]|uniref:Insulin-like growth factor-binding protein 3 n=1 Tax=Solea senegalensis TaxID=28829 RepID=A0AAV6QPE9_SOLSE|nr:insulin-like growth factor-binding protein 3 [Solea senegalensis]KAG7495003.1 insulin-like growth factor-binding protein 3 [Solea senegalensis]